MGDYDGEIYRSVDYIYNEVTTIRSGLNSLNQTMAQVVEELKGLRQDVRDLARQEKSPI